MCGIIAAASSTRDVVPFLFEGLRKLEYRGYDSWGLAIWNTLELKIVREIGHVSKATRPQVTGTVGIAHTRWATHGKVSPGNTHPIAGGPQLLPTVWVVHNGIIENYAELRRELEAKAYVFQTGTDTEVIAHLADEYINHRPRKSDLDGLALAIADMCRKLKGQYAFALMTNKCPEGIFLVSHQAPLAITGDGLAASDPAALGQNASYRFLGDGEIGYLDNDRSYVLRDGRLNDVIGITHQVKQVEPQQVSTCHMLSEIIEQKGCMGWVGEPSSKPPDCSRFVLFGCGSSYYAAQFARHSLEQHGNPTRVEYATELVHQPLFDDGDTFYVGVTQSGETRDTLRCLRHLVERVGKDRVRCLTNVSHSTAARLVEPILMNCGPEIGVAATKTFLASCLRLVELNTHISVGDASQLVQTINTVLDSPRQDISLNCENVLLFANGPLYPIACEGALKLKEVAQVHAEAILSSEVKHGPISLIDGGTQSVFLLDGQSKDAYRVISNMEEVAARGGAILCITDEPTAEIVDYIADNVIKVPRISHELQPLVILIVLQLLAYETALERNLDVDRPRGLAKCVSV
jgi:glucosamine--fructose-6-phosphate aminotransferase (isomerizing)